MALPFSVGVTGRDHLHELFPFSSSSPQSVTLPRTRGSSLTVPYGRATMSVLTPRPRLSGWLRSALRRYSAQLKGGNDGKRLAALEAVDAEVASV